MKFYILIFHGLVRPKRHAYSLDGISLCLVIVLPFFATNEMVYQDDIAPDHSYVLYIAIYIAACMSYNDCLSLIRSMKGTCVSIIGKSFYEIPMDGYINFS